MAAYVVLFREGPVRDPEEMAEYRRKSPKDSHRFGLKPLTVYGAQEAIEGEPPDGVIILEFPSMEEAKAWYHDPAYQEAARHRLNAADYRGVIVEGFTPPA